MRSLRTGIIGLGRMGRHHVRCTQQAEGLELVGASDADPAKAASLPAAVPFHDDPRALIDACDAIVLAVPTDRHLSLGRDALRSGCHVLVEKPLASSPEECEELQSAAREAGVVLGVGHVERMNGAFLEARKRIANPRFVEGHRLAPFDVRGTEVDVVFDLMIHDLDLVLQMFDAFPVAVDAVGVAVLTDQVDIANARLEFPGGGLVNLTASRVSRDPIRKLRVFQEDAYLSLDFHEQVAEIFARDAGAGPLGVAREEHGAPEGHNPLVRELEEFAAAARGETSTLPTAEEGTRAVTLAARIQEAMQRRLASSTSPADESWADAPS